MSNINACNFKVIFRALSGFILLQLYSAAGCEAVLVGEI